MENDGSPLMLALGHGGAEVAPTLVRHGARVDNVVSAAALGRLDLVKDFVDEGGTLRPHVFMGPIRWFEMPTDPRAQIRLALTYAARYGRADVVTYLLDRGADIAAADNDGFTPLHWAAWRGDVDLARTLVARRAPLEAKNAYGGTVLDLAVWATMNIPSDIDRLPVIDFLIGAGARVDAVSPFPTGNEVVDAALARAGRKA